MGVPKREEKAEPEKVNVSAGTQKSTFWLDEDVHRKLKAKAALMGISLSGLVQRIFEEWLLEQKK